MQSSSILKLVNSIFEFGKLILLLASILDGLDLSDPTSPLPFNFLLTNNS